MELPSGTVTFLFTDIEGSTRLFHELGDGYMAVLEEHHRRVRSAIAAHGGVEVKTEGDAFFVAFADAAAALHACVDAQTALGRSEGWPEGQSVRVRMGLHTGPVAIVDNDYVGLSVHEAARIAAAGHGGQVLVSEDAASAIGDRTPAGVELRDLGRHALKDFPEPRRLFQVTHPELVMAFPPLRTLTARGHNLPSAAATFVGRAEEMSAIQRLLLGDARLVTLLGSGGMGKSRLAIEAGWSLLSWFPEGVWFVGLAAVLGPAGVTTAVCDALGVGDTAGVSRDDALRERLSAGPILLIVDNLEHLLDAATLLSDLLADCPPLRILATSRERLRLRGEHVLQLPSLSLPALGDAADVVATTEAGRLFADRATAHRASFTVDDSTAAAVVDICTRLDGVPLALELAAARTFDMEVGELASRLGAALDVLVEGERDLPTRQQTLRATVRWSYDLLKPAAQELLCSFSVFAGGAALPAVEAVHPGGGVEALLGTLSDASLIQQGDPARVGPVRWWLLETVRQFAAERLEDAAETDARVAAHAAWALDLAERAAPNLTGPDQAAWLEVLEADRANLNAAIERADDATRLAISARLIRFWSIRGHWTEGRRQLGVALAGTGRREDLAEAQFGAGHLAMRQHDLAAAHTLLRAASELATELGLDALAANCHNQLGEVAALNGDADTARAEKDTALRLAREAGDDRLTGLILNDLAKLIYVAEGPAAALPLFEDALAMFRRQGATFNVTEVLSNLALCVGDAGDTTMARAYIEECLELTVSLGDGPQRANALTVLAGIELDDGDARRGIDLLVEAAAILIEGGSLEAVCSLASSLMESYAALAETTEFFVRVPALATRAGHHEAADRLTKLGARQG
ncbi:MAG: tetratricopeptide repeat protein [Acidimicrobiales bacterium]